MKLHAFLGFFLTFPLLGNAATINDFITTRFDTIICPLVEEWHESLKIQEGVDPLYQLRLAAQVFYIDAAKTKANRNMQKSLSRTISFLHKIELKQEPTEVWETVNRELNIDKALWHYFDFIWNDLESLLNQESNKKTADLLIQSSVLRLQELDTFLATQKLHKKALEVLTQCIETVESNCSLIQQRLKELYANPEALDQLLAETTAPIDYNELKYLHLFENAQLTAKDIVDYLFDATTASITIIEPVYSLSMLIDVLFYKELYRLIETEYAQEDRFNFVIQSNVMGDHFAQKLPLPSDLNLF